MESQDIRTSLWATLEDIAEGVGGKRLADVFRFVSFRPFEPYGPHQHLRIEINYVKKGACMICLDGENVTFRKGEVMIITSNVSHRFEAGPEGATLMQLEFLPEIFAQLAAAPMPFFPFSEEHRLIKIVNNTAVIGAVQRIISELRQKKPHYQHMVVMHYAELLILIVRYIKECYLPICTSEPMKRAVAFIRQNYCRSISIADAAACAGVSERYLRRLFAQYVGLSPIDYLNQMRISKAVELLRGTDMLVKEICFKCGFQSPQYFSRVFKQQMGVPPHKIVR